MNPLLVGRMASKLDAVTDWTPVARRAGLDAARLAALCGVSLRRLEQYSHGRFDCSPHAWLRHLKLVEAVASLARGASVKEAAAQCGYADSATFSHAFQRVFRCSPLDFLRRNQARKAQISHLDNFVSLSDNRISLLDNQSGFPAATASGNGQSNALILFYENSNTAASSRVQHGPARPTDGPQAG